MISKISLFKIRRSQTACISCGKCDNECPMLIDVSEKKKVTDTLCNRCMKCTAEVGGCPVDGACCNGIFNEKKREAAK